MVLSIEDIIISYEALMMNMEGKALKYHKDYKYNLLAHQLIILKHLHYPKKYIIYLDSSKFYTLYDQGNRIFIFYK